MDDVSAALGARFGASRPGNSDETGYFFRISGLGIQDPTLADAVLDRIVMVSQSEVGEMLERLLRQVERDLAGE